MDLFFDNEEQTFEYWIAASTEYPPGSPPHVQALEIASRYASSFEEWCIIGRNIPSGLSAASPLRTAAFERCEQLAFNIRDWQQILMYADVTSPALRKAAIMITWLDACMYRD